MNHPDHPPRNPFRSEADAFRLLVIVVVAGAAVVAVGLLLGGGAGFALALVLIAIGLWRAIGLLQDWRRRG